MDAVTYIQVSILIPQLEPIGLRNFRCDFNVISIILILRVLIVNRPYTPLNKNQQ
jgi:hypothetical protein